MTTQEERQVQKAKALLTLSIIGGIIGLLLGFGESQSDALLGVLKDSAKGLASGFVLATVIGLFIISPS